MTISLADIQYLARKIGLTCLRDRPIRAQLHEKFHGVPALRGDPARVEFRVAASAGFAVVAVSDGRFGSHEQAAAGGEGLGFGYGGNAVGRVEQDATCRGREGACDVGLHRTQVLFTGVDVNGFEHASQGVSLIHGDDGEHAVG